VIPIFFEQCDWPLREKSFSVLVFLKRTSLEFLIELLKQAKGDSYLHLGGLADYAVGSQLPLPAKTVVYAFTYQSRERDSLFYREAP